MAYLLNKPITIVDYDLRWPLWYEEEKARLIKALALLEVRIEHIGSTAVPGLAAKPILDISLALADREQIEPYCAALRALGYAEIPINPMFERRMFSKGVYNEGSHHLHVTTYGTAVWVEPILLRDYLRAHPAVAARYAAVKRAAAAQHQHDLNGYHDQKSELITQIMEQAHAWQPENIISRKKS
jgi:GrpB-like predicted nucleotidyltransferase (UPF0157 family)